MKNGDKPASPILLKNGYQFDGLTTREVFAMAAMQGLLSAGIYKGKDIAGRAVECADAVLAKLELEQ